MKKMMNLHYSNDNETKFCEIAYLVIYLSCKDESLKNTWLTSEVFAYSKPEWKIGFWDKACWNRFFLHFLPFLLAYLMILQISRLWLLITIPKICQKSKSSKYAPYSTFPIFWMIPCTNRYRYPKILFWIPDPLLSLTLIRM